MPADKIQPKHSDLDDLELPEGLDRRKGKPEVVASAEEPLVIAKPAGFSLDKYKSKRSAALAGVETMPTALPIHRIPDAKDFVRLHPDEDNYWSDELCFASVPVKGEKDGTLHLIDEDLAMEFLQPARILHFRLALAVKPWDVCFLCQVPTRNLNNTWNRDNLKACLLAKDNWVMATSRRAEGIDGYKIDFSKHADAFAKPKWPTQSLSELIEATFAGREIDHEDHPGLLRLLGAKQDVS